MGRVKTIFEKSEAESYFPRGISSKFGLSESNLDYFGYKIETEKYHNNKPAYSEEIYLALLGINLPSDLENISFNNANMCKNLCYIVANLYPQSTVNLIIAIQKRFNKRSHKHKLAQKKLSI